VEEIKKHREEICKRIGLKTESFSFILEELILPKLNIVEESKYADKFQKPIQYLKSSTKIQVEIFFGLYGSL
jgi:predicted nucleic acid-binding protein